MNQRGEDVGEPPELIEKLFANNSTLLLPENKPR
jgi:hypothetical protein